MISEELSRIGRELAQQGSLRERYTEQAFHLLPPQSQPRILDVGCGQGGPTLQLARLSGGRVVGLDLHRPSLRILARQAQQAGLGGRVHVLIGSMQAMGFAEGCFDLVWSEGAVFIMGLENGLRLWHRLLRPGGYAVIHEAVWLRQNTPPQIRRHCETLTPGTRTVPENLACIERCGYSMIAHFTLPEDAWWTGYYQPLQTRLRHLREGFAGRPAALVMLDAELQKVRLFRRCQKWYGSAFFVMKATSDHPAEQA